MGLRDMFSAISGLQANSTWLDVIGNNIANTNTVAYKASRVEFATQFSQTLNAGTGDNTGSNLGGTDPQQIGLGTRVQSIQTIWTEGAIQNTGNATDVAINGNGFLVSKTGDSTYYTRAGNLTFDSNGNLVDSAGGLIQGFTAQIEYTQTTINSTNGNAVAEPLKVTNANLVVDNSNLSAASNIQINPNFVEPAKATSTLNFVGNLDSFQQAQVLAVVENGQATLPIGLAGVTLNANKMGKNAAYPPPAGTETVLVENNDLAALQDANNAGHTTAIVTGGVSLNILQAAAQQVNYNFAWSQQPPVTPALTSSQTVYDSVGTPHTITTLFYQVNDLGTANPAINASPLNQVAYAWYSFDTTNGAAVSTATLLGGTGIYEGSGQPIAPNANPADGYDRGIAGTTYEGDLLYFNSDGSLASMGGSEQINGNTIQCAAHVYLPAAQVAAPPNPAAATTPVSPIPTLGAEIMDITMNFGTAGYTEGPGDVAPGTIVGAKRDGLYSDAEGTYQVLNGVNTYVANSHATTSQNGYADGNLQSISFDTTGTIQGQFSNGQTTALGQVLMASFENEGGLNAVGTNYYTTSSNTGAVTLGLANKNGMGAIEGGSLEASNVDLTVELSNMIIAQRGFDVNSRVISVENANLQVLTQLGQGG
jgi:flagellar hook protein FlgE